MYFEWTTGNTLTMFSLFVAIFGARYAYLQLAQSNKIRRAEFLDKIIERIRFNESFARTMNMIDYSTDWYNKEFHNTDSKLEYEVDMLLSYFSYVCYLYESNCITRDELSVLRYELNRICSSKQIQNYLWNLYHFSIKIKTTSSFASLIEYGIREKLILEDEFINKDSPSYTKHLNF